MEVLEDFQKLSHCVSLNMERLEECHNSFIHVDVDDYNGNNSDEILEFDKQNKDAENCEISKEKQLVPSDNIEDTLGNSHQTNTTNDQEKNTNNTFYKTQDEILKEVLLKLENGKDVFEQNKSDISNGNESCDGNKKKGNKKQLDKGDNSKTTYTCEVCNRSFLYISKLRYHERIHLNIRPHKCLTCGRGFLDKSGLKQHISTHTKEKNFHCTVCPKVFSSSSNLGTHMKRIHETDPDKIKKYTCEICFRVTSTAFNLRVHYQTHTGIKQFSCDVCHLYFAHKTSLNVHKKIHTGEVSKTCEYCDKSFVSSSNYHRHVRMHRGEKPFSCSECSKVFADSSNLSKHKRIHTKEKLYACHICDNLYTFSNHLSRHKKRCHPELQTNFVKIVELPIEMDEDETKKESVENEDEEK